MEVYIVMFVDENNNSRHISGRGVFLSRSDAKNYLEAYKIVYPQHSWYIHTMELVAPGV